jgi:GNAT superfamily N-acetyltransferase
MLLFGVYPKKRPLIPVVRHVRWWVVKAWTLVQVACGFTIFAVAQFAPVGYIYPALLALLVPFRSYVLHRFFKEEDMKHLDPADETEEEYHDEQRMVHENERRGSVDEEDIAFPTRAEFRGQGLKRALMNSNRRHTIGHESDDILALDVAKARINLDLDDIGK